MTKEFMEVLRRLAVLEAKEKVTALKIARIINKLETPSVDEIVANIKRAKRDEEDLD